MALPTAEPNGDDNDRRSRSITSPFVAFKKFADEQFSTLMSQTFGTSPFLLSPAVSYHQFKKDYEDWLKEARNEETRFTHAFADASEPATKCPYREPAAATMAGAEARDLQSFLGGTEYDEDDVMLKRPRIPPDQVGIPLSYILTSPYSPINLETQLPELSSAPTTLRAAFEDLLRIQSGLPLSVHPSEQSRSAETPSQWVSTMINLMIAQRADNVSSRQMSSRNVFKQKECPYMSEQSREGATCTANETEGSLGNILSQAMAFLVTPDQLGNLIDAVVKDGFEQTSHGCELDEVADEAVHEDLLDELVDESSMQKPFTELDVIQRLLGIQRPPSTSKILDLVAQGRRKKQDWEAESHDIISTLETTSKTRLPDGSVSTKITLQKRFSDGREESVETHHQQSPPAERPSAKWDRKREQHEKGWFWN